MKTGRNDPCPCGSGQKYKKCHLPKDDAARAAELAAAASTIEPVPTPSPDAVAAPVALTGAARTPPPRARPKTSGAKPPLFRRRAV